MRTKQVSEGHNYSNTTPILGKLARASELKRNDGSEKCNPLWQTVFPVLAPNSHFLSLSSYWGV